MHTVVSLRFTLWLLGGFLCLGAGLFRPAQADTFSTLRSFAAAETSPAAMIQGQDGAFYGTTETGGAGGVGSVFTMKADGSGYRVLHSFGVVDSQGRLDGAQPVAALLQAADGALYGTTFKGGANNTGTVFKINTDGTGETVIHSFAPADGNGIYPEGMGPAAALVQSNNNAALYGTTWQGGTGGSGVVFGLNTDGSGFTVVYPFTSDSSGTNFDGAQPTGALFAGNGNVMGTTSAGGANGKGVIFSVNLDGSAHQILHSFGDANVTDNSGAATKDGAAPHSGLINLSSTGTDFYGTTPWGGANGAGVVFKVTFFGGYNVLHSFPATDGNGANSEGARPYAPLTTINGTLYGTASEGGPGSVGTIFTINSDGSGFAPVYSFSGQADFSGGGTADGAAPTAGLTLAADGSLYGATSQGGVNGTGTIFQIAGGLMHVLWDNADGTLSLWTVNAGGAVGHREYGPYPGWTAQGIADGPDGKTRVFWTNAGDGRSALWTVGADGSVTSRVYPANPAGWTFQALAVDPAGLSHVLWLHAPDGQMGLWTIDASGVPAGAVYGPYPGWSALDMAIGPASHVHVLWTHAPDGLATLWDIAPGAGPSSAPYGPYPGWSPLKVAVGPDSHVHLLWFHASDGLAALWDIKPGSGPVSAAYGPAPGWTPLSLGVSADNHVHALWRHTSDGLTALWDVDTQGRLLAAGYGPYFGWNAAALTVGSSAAFSGLQSRLRPLVRPLVRPKIKTRSASAAPHRLEPRRRIRPESASSFGDWGQFALDGALHMSQPDSVALVPLSPGFPTQAVCITDSVDTSGNSLSVTNLAFFQTATNQAYGLNPYPVAAMPIAADLLGDLYLGGPTGILVQRQDASIPTPTQFTPVSAGLVPTGGPVSALTVDAYGHQVFFAAGGQIYRAVDTNPDPPVNLHLEGQNNISALAAGPGDCLYALSGSQIRKFVPLGGGYFPDIAFTTPAPLTNLNRIAVDNSIGGSGDVFVTTGALDLMVTTGTEPSSQVLQFDSSGNLLAALSSNPTISEDFNAFTYFSLDNSVVAPLGIAVDSTGTVWIVEHGEKPANGGFGVDAGPYENRIVSYPPG